MTNLAAGALFATLMMASPAHPAQPSASDGGAAQSAPTVRQSPPASNPAVAQDNEARVLRGKANLEALRQGSRSVNSLSPQEMQDVLALEGLLRGEGAGDRSYSQQCVDREVRRAGGRPSQLAWEIIKLKCK